MTKMKKVVAVVLAFLMIFSSVSVMAFADFDLAASDGTALTVKAEIGKVVSETWTAVDKVVRGDTVTARVSVGTDYYSNSSQLLFFYDKSFFNTDGIANVLTVNNPVFSAGSYAFTSDDDNVAKGLINKGLVTADYLENYGFVLVNLQAAEGTANFKYDLSSWQFAVTLNVNDDAEGVGSFFILDSTVLKTTNPRGVVNVPKGPEGGSVSETYNMYYWNASFDGCSDSVTVNVTTTLDPNGGTWTADSSTDAKAFDGITGEALSIPALTNGNKTLHGWYDASLATPTKADCVDLTTFDAFADITYNAYWIDKINITFDLNGGSIGGSTESIVAAVTPEYEWGVDHTDPAAPVREGYDFRGWSADPAASPQAKESNVFPAAYPAAETTYYAIWAKAVTLTFTDTFAGSSLGTISGFAGDAITEQAPQIPEYEGYYAATGAFIPAVPAVFPADDADYYAYYEPVESVVTFNIMNGDNVYQTLYRNVSYGSKIVSKDTVVVKAPEGMQIVGWFTDAACKNEFDYNTPVTGESITLYGYIAEAKYTVTFDANGGEWEDGSTEKPQDVAYLGTITLPETPTREGYEFTGWTPEMEVLNVDKDITILATWKLKEYNVTYVVNGEIYEAYTATVGEDFDVPGDPYVANASFIGWDLCSDPADYASGDGETDGFPETVTEDVTYVALFSVTVSYIIYKDNISTDAANIFMQIDRDISAGNLILPEGSVIAKAPDGMELVGWYTDTTWGDGAKFDHSTVMGNESVQIYAYLKARTYTVTFDANGGEWEDGSTEKPQDVAYLGTITPPAANPARDGYVFAGWDPEVSILSNESNITIRAMWELDTYTASFYSDETLVAEYDIDFGEDLDYPEDPFKPGFTFMGWDICSDPEDMGSGDGEADDLNTVTMPASDVVIVAIWEEITTPIAVTVKWNANGGKWADDDTVKSETGYFFKDEVTAYSTAPSPAEGYEFKGWASSADASEPDAALLVSDYIETADAGSLVNVKNFYAVYALQTVVPVNFYIPERNAAEGEGYGTLTANLADYKLLDSDNTHKPGDAVPAAEGNTDIQYYKFLGWSTDGTAATIIDKTATIPSGGANYYAVYEREAVYLIVKTDGTASIDRRGNEIGTWNTLFTDAAFTLDNYKNASSYSLWFVHVQPGFRVTTKSNPYLDKYFAVSGDGEITVTKGADGYGTGTLITVTDKVTGKTAEKFYVAIYGDVNGDTYVNADDVGEIFKAYKGTVTWHKRGTYDHAKIMAANLSAPTRLAVNADDYTALKNIYGKSYTLNPLTGDVTKVQK